MKLMIDGLGLNMEDPNLKDTPKRVAKMFCQELFSGLTDEPPKITTFPNTKNYTGIILLNNIPFTSVCSHHFLPFQGLAWFLYLPKDLLVGASKISRLITYHAARPQIQEQLTQEIVDHFVTTVNPLGAMLVMRAVHGCMSCRGIKQTGGLTTSVVHGSFADNLSTREEGMELIKLSNRVM
jgi:GTP cyclohydrolase I